MWCYESTAHTVCSLFITLSPLLSVFLESVCNAKPSGASGVGVGYLISGGWSVITTINQSVFHLWARASSRTGNYANQRRMKSRESEKRERERVGNKREMNFSFFCGEGQGKICYFGVWIRTQSLKLLCETFWRKIAATFYLMKIIVQFWFEKNCLELFPRKCHRRYNFEWQICPFLYLKKNGFIWLFWTAEKTNLAKLASNNRDMNIFLYISTNIGFRGRRSS